MSEVDEKGGAPKRERGDVEADDAANEPPVKQQKKEPEGTGEVVKASGVDAPEDSAKDKAVAEISDETKPVDNADASKEETKAEEKEETTTSANNETKGDSKASTADDPSPTTGKESTPVQASTVQPTSSQAPAPAPAPAATTQNVPAGLPAGLPPGIGGVDSDPNAIIEEKGSVSALFVGRVIGKGGEMIRDLQARSSCRIDVDQNVPAGQPRVITYKGTRSTIDFAKHLVELLCRDNASESDLPLGDAKREFMLVPPQSVGKIIGRGGEMIRELQSRSQAKIQVDHSGHGSSDQQKHVTITGSELAVTKAKEMISFLVANPLMDAMQSINMLVEDKLHRGGVWGSGPPYVNLPNMGQNMQPNAGGMGGSYGYDQPGYGGGPQSNYQSGPPPGQGYGSLPPYGGGHPSYQQQPPQSSYAQYGGGGGGGGVEMEIFYAAKTFMGRIIGQKGVTINDLQKRSSCDIQINQDVPPGRDCEISIRGSREGIEMTKQMLREIIEVGPNHPYAGGGAPSHMGGYQQNPYGQQQPYQQQPAYGGGHNQPYGQTYGGYNQGYQAQPAYGQPYGGGYQQPPAPYSAPPPAAPQASSWKSATSPDGQVYYYNAVTGATQWEKPPNMP